jgi:hypothetical protein
MDFKMDGFLETPSTLTLKFMLHKTRRAQVKKNLQALAESGFPAYCESARASKATQVLARGSQYHVFVILHIYCGL